MGIGFKVEGCSQRLIESVADFSNAEVILRQGLEDTWVALFLRGFPLKRVPPSFFLGGCSFFFFLVGGGGLLNQKGP